MQNIAYFSVADFSIDREVVVHI